MPPQTTTPATLDDVLEQYVGKTGTVRQPAKGVWTDVEGNILKYRVVGGDEPDDGVFTLRLESLDTLRRFVPANQEKGTDARWEDAGKPKSVVPNCPLKWFKPA